MFETIYTLSIGAEWHSHGLNIDRCILTLATLITPRLMAGQFRLIFTVIFSQVPLTSPFLLPLNSAPLINIVLIRSSHRPPMRTRVFLPPFFRHPVYITILNSDRGFWERKVRSCSTNNSRELDPTFYFSRENFRGERLRTAVSRVDIVSRVLRGSLPFLTRFTDTRARDTHTIRRHDHRRPTSTVCPLVSSV